MNRFTNEIASSAYPLCDRKQHKPFTKISLSSKIEDQSSLEAKWWLEIHINASYGKVVKQSG